MVAAARLFFLLLGSSKVIQTMAIDPPWFDMVAAEFDKETKVASLIDGMMVVISSGGFSCVAEVLGRRKMIYEKQRMRK